jgi:hypothetical protein
MDQVPTVAVAFTEWERRSRETPELFQTEFQKLAGTEEEYGAACEPYFNALVKELGICLLTQAQKDSLVSILRFVEQVKFSYPALKLSAEAVEILIGTWFRRPE